MDEVLACELDAIPWFGAVGQPVTTALSLPIIQVATWAEAFACYDESWEALKERARSALQAHPRHDRPGRWNELIRAVKQRVTIPLEAGVWRPYAARHPVHPLFPELVAWDVLMAAMEHEYRAVRGRPQFWLPLLDVYRIGHFPCGWVGDWPEGQLVIL